jgi:hypothetical protein
MSWTIDEVIRDSLRAFKRDWVALVFGNVVSILIAIAPMGVWGLLGVLPVALTHPEHFEPGAVLITTGVLSALASFVLMVLFAPAQTRMTLASLRGQPVQIGDIFRFQRSGTFLFAGMCVGLAVMGAFLLLIVPGIIVMLGLVFTAYFVVDGPEDRGAMAALEASWQKSRGHRLHFLGLAVLAWVVQLVVNLVAGSTVWLLPLNIALQLAEPSLMALGIGAVYLRINAAPAPPAESFAPPALLPHEPSVIVSV